MIKKPRVLNTRPAPKSTALSHLLEANGIEVVEYCPIIIEALPNLSNNHQAKNIAYNLDQFSDIIITSGFAANIGLDFLANFWPQWPKTCWWSIGSSTNKNMQAFTIDALVPDLDSIENSESLLQALQLKWNTASTDRHKPTHISARNVLIITGQQGRGLLQSELNKTGVSCSILEVYKRTTNPQPLPINVYDAIVMTSVDIAKHILLNTQVLDQFGSSCHFICASDRITDFVKSKGAVKVVNSGSANNESLSEYITRLIL